MHLPRSLSLVRPDPPRVDRTTNDNDGGGGPGAGTDYRASVWTAGFALNSIQLKSDVGVHPGYPWPETTPGSKLVFMARTSMLGAWQLCGVEPNVTAYREHLALYKTKQRPILRGGAMYHVLPKPDGVRTWAHAPRPQRLSLRLSQPLRCVAQVNWDGFQFYHRGLKRGSLLVFKPSPNVSSSQVIRLKGLDAATSYRLRFQDRTAQSATKSGAELMGAGLNISGMEGAFASEIVWVE